jgi:hypothetical protein
VQPAAGFGWARLAIQAGFLGPARISRFDRIVSLAAGHTHPTREAVIGSNY